MATARSCRSCAAFATPWARALCSAGLILVGLVGPADAQKRVLELPTVYANDSHGTARALAGNDIYTIELNWRDELARMRRTR